MDIFNLFKSNKSRDFDKKIFLYIIGAQKTGTSWLWTYFKKHNQVFVPKQKEFHFFNCKYNLELNKEVNDIFEGHLKGMIENPDHKNLLKTSEEYRKSFDFMNYRKKGLKNDSYYLEFFKKYVTGETCFADITPRYSGLSSDVYKKMEKFHSNTKFIFIMRNPIERFCSGIKHRYEIPEINDKLIDDCINDIDFKLKSDYKSTIENLEKVVGREKILYLFYEDLFCDETIGKICDFLKIDFMPADYITRLRQTYVYDFNEAMSKRIFDSQKFVYDFIFEKFEDQTPIIWSETYKKWSALQK